LTCVPSQKRPKNTDASQDLTEDTSTIADSTDSATTIPKTPPQPRLGIDYIDLGRKSPSTGEYVKMKHDVISKDNTKNDEENERNRLKSADDPMELTVEDFF